MTRRRLSMQDRTNNNVGTSTALLPANTKRVALFVSAHSTEATSLGFGSTAVLNRGFTIMPLSAGLWITEEMIGDFIKGPINFICSGAATVGTVEVSEA